MERVASARSSPPGSARPATRDAALSAQPKLAWSLYARGLAKQRKGLKAEADADIAAALAIDANITARARQIGLIADAAPAAIKPAD